mgnify:CR=1 FL=1
MNNLNNIEKLMNNETITVDNSEQEQKDWESFLTNYEGYNKIVSSFDDINDLIPFAHRFYSNNLNPTVWNRILKETFQTKPSPKFYEHSKRKESLIDYRIQPSRERFDQIRFKTSQIERSLSHYLEDDITFSCDKPELLNAMGYQVYEVNASVLNESIVIPVNKIVETIRNFPYTGLLVYLLLNNNIPSNEVKDTLKTNNLTKLINTNLKFCLSLSYVNDSFYGNETAWNPIIKEYKSNENIGYFTVGGTSRMIGNVWVDPRFRGKGIATAIFQYLKKVAAGKDEAYIVTTKTEHMKAIFKKLGFKYVGNTYAYINDNYPYELKKHIKKNYIEEVYVITNKHMESVDYYMLCNAKMGYDEVLFTSEILNFSSNAAVIDMFTRDGFQFIGYTDANIYSTGYYNYYIEKDNTYPSMLFTHSESENPNEVIEYPLFNGILLSPENHRAIMKPINKLNFLVTNQNFDDTLDLHIGFTDGNSLFKSIQVIKNIYMNKVEIYKSLAYTIQTGNNLPNPFLKKLISEDDYNTYNVHSIESGYLTLAHKQEPKITKKIEI